MFSNEAMLDEMDFNSVELPPQAMITILKKGMLYMQLEKGINERARTEDSPDHIISGITETVKRKEPLQPPRPISRPKSAPAQAAAPAAPPELIEIPPDAVINLRGHFAGVYCGAFTPNGRFLATGSADATAIIWELRDDEYATHYILDHATQQERTGKDIASVAWNSVGTILATGCYDGTARLWTTRGELKSVLVRHTESVFCVQFSPDGTMLLTGSSDSKIIAWAVAAGSVVQVFSDHKQRVLDIDWLDNQTFASCSGDGKICVFQIGQHHAIATLQGHASEINKISWDPSRKMLASCSDDKTIRVWKPLEKVVPIVLQGHTGDVYTLKWAPNNQMILVSGAFDNTLRVWDVQKQTCLHVLTKHTQAIYTIAFSPKGQYFVSGGIDTEVDIWRTRDAALIASYRTTGGVFEAVWDSTGGRIALCSTDATVVVIPTAQIPLEED
jgi:transducin (beta)-like 1